MLLGAKTHVVTAVWCMLSAVPTAKVNLFEVFHQHVNCIWCLHVWDTHRLNRHRHFRSPADHSPLLLPLPPYRRLPRTYWPPSAWDVSNTALGVMSALSVQQLEPVNDSRRMLVSLKWGRRVRGVDQQRQWQYPSDRHVVVSTGQHAAWRVIEVELHSVRCLYVVARGEGGGLSG